MPQLQLNGVTGFVYWANLVKITLSTILLHTILKQKPRFIHGLGLKTLRKSEQISMMSTVWVCGKMDRQTNVLNKGHYLLNLENA